MIVSEDTIEGLQTKIAFLERANNELSDVVFRQQQQIQALAQRIESIVERLQSSQIDTFASSVEDERPPHY